MSDRILLERRGDTGGAIGPIYRSLQLKEEYPFYPPGSGAHESTAYKTPWLIKGSFGDYRFDLVARSYYWKGATPVEHERGEWSLKIKNPIAEERHEMVMPATADPYHVLGFLQSRSEYPLIQEAFPTLNVEQRDFILLGVSPEWWNKNFPQETNESTGDDSTCAVYEEDIRGNPLRGSAPSSGEGRSPKG